MVRVLVVILSLASLTQVEWLLVLAWSRYSCFTSRYENDNKPMTFSGTGNTGFLQQRQPITRGRLMWGIVFSNCRIIGSYYCHPRANNISFYCRWHVFVSCSLSDQFEQKMHLYTHSFWWLCFCWLCRLKKKIPLLFNKDTQPGTNRPRLHHRANSISSGNVTW